MDRLANRPVGMAVVAAMVFTALVPSSTRGADAGRPNVVIFLADDQGWGDIAANGNRQAYTPNIDTIARDGARIDRFFVCPVCSPTRAEFLTGRYHSRGGVSGTSSGQERLDLDERTIAEAFKAAGYATGAFGKWHNGSQWPYHPNARGFEEYYGFTSGHWGQYYDAPLEHNGQFVRGKGYIADDFTNHAIEFIEKNVDKPFFCYLPFNTPHSPFAVPAEYWAKYKDKPITMTARPEDVAKEDQQVTRCVLAMNENLDMNVGRVLKRLDQLKLAENTIVIYFSDNGPNSERWNADVKGKKASVDEGGVRAPFFIRWPGKIQPGKTVTQIAGAIDLLPTLTAFAGIPRVGDKPLDGMDLSPLLLANAVVGSWPDRMIFSHRLGNASVRTQQYRLSDSGALYDLATDPGQRKNIAKEKPEIAARLTQAVADWRKDVFQNGAPKLETPKIKGDKIKGEEDTRPYPVGYPEFPMTPLPARDGVPYGGVKRSGSAPNCSYFVDWTSNAGYMDWDIEVNTTGEYDAIIYYTCPEADAGSTIELSFKESKTTATVAPGWDPPLIHDDTLPRPDGESTLKEFKPLSLGTMQLEKGRGKLTLKALDVPGKHVMDVRLITLTLKTGAKSPSAAR